MVARDEYLSWVGLSAKPVTKISDLLRTSIPGEVPRVQQDVAIGDDKTTWIGLLGRMRVTDDYEAHMIIWLWSWLGVCRDLKLGIGLGGLTQLCNFQPSISWLHVVYFCRNLGHTLVSHCFLQLG